MQLGAAHLALTSAHARNPPSFYPAPFFLVALQHNKGTSSSVSWPEVSLKLLQQTDMLWPVIYGDNRNASMDSGLRLGACCENASLKSKHSICFSFLFFFSFSCGVFIYKCGAPVWSTTALSPPDLKKMWPERALFVFPHSAERRERHKSHNVKSSAVWTIMVYSRSEGKGPEQRQLTIEIEHAGEIIHLLWITFDAVKLCFYFQS